MSSEFTLCVDENVEVVLTERSAKFDLDVYECADDGKDMEGPQQMSPRETLTMAANIMYAVWCSYPDEVEAFIEKFQKAGICTVFNRLQWGDLWTNEAASDS